MRANYQGLPINTSRNTHEQVFRLIDCARDSTIVDVPCGAGAFVKRLRDAGFSRIVAVDIENLLEIEHEDFVIGDMNGQFQLDSDSIDTLVCIDGIEHLHRQVDFIREVQRVLKPRGALILSTPNISSLRSRWRWLLSGHHNKCKAPLDENEPSPLHHIGMISFPEIRYLLHSNGLEITDIRTNRIKPVSLFFTPLLPFVWLYTTLSYRRAADSPSLRALLPLIKQRMFSLAVLFGETIIVKARKRACP